MLKKPLRPLRERKSPNRKAPKFTKKRHRILNREFIHELKKENPELVGYKERDICKIVREFHEEFVIDYILNNREPLELPYMMGRMFIAVTGKYYPIDQKTSNDLGKDVHYRRNHSDGYGGRVFYSTSGMPNTRVLAYGMWGFEPATGFKKRLAGKMMDGETWKMYMHVRNPKFVQDVLRTARGKQAHTTWKKDKFAEYDELFITED